MATGDALTADAVRGWLALLAEVPLVEADFDRIDELRALEELKGAVEARQARLTAAFDASQRQRAAEQGVPAEWEGRGIAEQVAYARRVSPHRGRQLVGLAKALVGEMPYTLAALTEGAITEWRATVLARETACLSRENRARVDQELAGDVRTLSDRSNRNLEAAARSMAARLDAASVAERRRRAEADRCVTIRPAPDTMAYVTALLPVAQGVAVYAALSAVADAATATGQATNRGQVMADTFVRRLTGLAGIAAPVVPVAINLTMSARTLFAGADDPVELAGYGPIPAELGRGLVADALDAGSRTWLRRLFADPLTGRLTAMDATARRFPARLARFLDLRDRFCRNPWCNARIRHHDHIQDAAQGGPTNVDNGQGLCEACNHAKQSPGWSVRTLEEPGRRHTVEITTPTGHTYRSTAPPTPGSGVEIRLPRAPDLVFAA